MARFVIIVVAFLLAGVALACAGGTSDPPQQDTLSTPTASPDPTLIPTPSPPPVDFTKECGPPLSEFYCATIYRPPPSSCPISRVWKIRDDGLVGIGRPPLWMVWDPVFGPFESHPAKTIWIVADENAGEVKLTGRRLDGSGVAVFLTYQRDEGFFATGGSSNPENLKWDRIELVLVPPHGLGEDHRTTVGYPSAGCWRFTAQVGTEKVEIVWYYYE